MIKEKRKEELIMIMRYHITRCREVYKNSSIRDAGERTCGIQAFMKCNCGIPCASRISRYCGYIIKYIHTNYVVRDTNIMKFFLVK